MNFKNTEVTLFTISKVVFFKKTSMHIIWEFIDCYTIPKMFTNNYKGMGISCLCICCKFLSCRPKFFSSELLKSYLTNSSEILPQWSPGHRIKGSFLSFLLDWFWGLALAFLNMSPKGVKNSLCINYCINILFGTAYVITFPSCLAVTI